MSLNETDIGMAMQTLIMNFLAGNVHTAMPGRVERYNPSKRTADIKPMLKMAGTDGSQTEIEVLPDVPVAIYGTADAAIVLPIKSGDFVLLIFAERSTDRFMESGKVSNTSLNRHYHLSDAVAFPGIFPRNMTNESTESNDIAIYNNGGKVTVKASGDIELGGSSLQHLMTKAAMDAFNTHVHLVTIPSLATPTPSAAPTVSMTEIVHCTSKVKAQ